MVNNLCHCIVFTDGRRLERGATPVTHKLKYGYCAGGLQTDAVQNAVQLSVFATRNCLVYLSVSGAHLRTRFSLSHQRVSKIVKELIAGKGYYGKEKFSSSHLKISLWQVPYTWLIHIDGDITSQLGIKWMHLIYSDDTSSNQGTGMHKTSSNINEEFDALAKTETDGRNWFRISILPKCHGSKRTE